jgi:hypothetical protein
MKQFLLGGIALAVLVLAPASLAGGARIVATVEEPFEVDGRLFPAGAVTLREASRFSPTQTLNELWVGDECLGRLLAVPASDYWGRVEDALLFQRDPEGHLDLVGFALKGREAQEFRF